MSRRSVFGNVIPVAGIVCSFLLCARGEDSAAAELAGARPTIDASLFPSIQAALDAIPPEGGKVVLPAGVFEIREPLRVRTADVCLEGAGGATHIKNINTDGAPALVLAHADHRLAGNENEKALWRVRLANFRISGNHASGHGIAAYNINEIHIDGITSSDHGGDGVLLSFCYEDPRVCDSLFTYNKATGLNLVGCHDIVVSSNQFEENQDALHCFDGFNLCMTGNCLDDHLGRGVVIENTYGSVVSGNMIEECRAEAVVLDRDCYGITLAANVIAHNGGGIDLRDAHGCAVTANTFTIVKQAGLRIGPGSGRITVAGNNFASSFIGEGRDQRAPDDRTAAGLVLAGTSDISVSGNLFSGLTTPAVSLEGDASRRVLFVGNVLTDAQSQHADLQQSVVADNVDP